LGYEDGDEVEVDIRRKLVSRKQRKESNTAWCSFRNTKSNEKILWGNANGKSKRRIN
jgi:hypothetical protein